MWAVDPCSLASELDQDHGHDCDHDARKLKRKQLRLHDDRVPEEYDQDVYKKSDDDHDGELGEIRSEGVAEEAHHAEPERRSHEPPSERPRRCPAVD